MRKPVRTSIAILCGSLLALQGWSCGTAGDQSSYTGTEGSGSSSSSSKTRSMTIPEGTVLTVALESTLRTDVNNEGDEIHAHTTEAIRIDGMTALPAGSPVHGRLTHVEEPHRTAGKAEMTLSFVEFTDASGTERNINTDPIVLVGQGDKISDEEKVAGGAVIGGIIGALTSKKKAQGAATGAAVGAAAGGAIALATKGSQLELPRGQRFSIELNSPVKVTMTQTTASR